MSEQHEAWSRAASFYEAEFVDPYRRDVKNPLLRLLRRIRDAQHKTVADLGCGIGPLLPFLAERFGKVYAVDFAPGMLERARERCRAVANVEFLERPLADLAPLAGRVDLAVAVNSLVMPDPRDIDRALREIHACLVPGGRFLGIVPAMDGVHYYTMLLLDRALAGGKPLDAARRNAAAFAEHKDFDFAFGQYHFRGLEQHFWQPFEIGYRLRRAGFQWVRRAKVKLAWKQFALFDDLSRYPPPWDWFFQCRRSATSAPS